MLTSLTSEGHDGRERGAAAPLSGAADTPFWRAEPLLTGTGALLLVALVGSVAGLVFDPRIITGAPAWLKPAKFALSTAIYCVTLAWVFTWLPDWPRMRRVVSRTTATVLLLEVAIIDVQAWRGTTSHFNVATPLDAALFGIMGVAIAIQTLASVAAAVALWRQVFADRVMGTALRAGMILTVTGASTGALMTEPTEAQLRELRETSRLELAGAHTVGAPDGGPGLPGTGWSRAHGDLRVPHFVGLHALQVLPVVAFALRRRRADAEATRLVRIGAASYATLFALLLAQALRGEALLNPGTIMLALFAAWGLATAVALWAAGRASRSPRPLDGMVTA